VKRYCHAVFQAVISVRGSCFEELKETERIKSHKSVHERNMPPSFPSLSVSLLLICPLKILYAVGSISPISQTLDVNE